MTVLIAVAFILIGLTSIILQGKNEFRFVPFINLLFLTAVSSVLLSLIEGSDKGGVLILMGIGAANFVLSQIQFLRKPGLRALLPLISMIAYIMLLNGEQINFNGESYPIINKFLVAGVVLATIGVELGYLKVQLIGKWFGEEGSDGFIKSMPLFVIGAGLFLGTVESGMLGLLVVATAYVSSSFFRPEEKNVFASSVLSLSLIPFLLVQSDYTSVNLLGADVLGGLFFGAFAAYFLQKMWDSPKRNGVIIAGAYLGAMVIAFAFLYNHMVYAKMGGMDSFLAFFIGAALALMITGKDYVATSLMPLLFVGGSLVPVLMVNAELEDFGIDVVSNTDESAGENEDLQALPFSDLLGSYKLQQSSKVSFSLGDEGEKTKGAFKQFSGSIIIAEDVLSSEFKIELAMEHFTTFNGFRDKSLLGSDYFSADKFPLMEYSGNQLKEVGENTYEILGQFTMLGVTKDVNVSVKAIEVNGQTMMIGTGEIDRTEFGMASSPQEGNVVSFEYQAVIK